MSAPAPDIAGLVAFIRNRVAEGELDLRDVGHLLTGKWDQDAPAALLQAATTLQSEHSARLAAEGRVRELEEQIAEYAKCSGEGQEVASFALGCGKCGHDWREANPVSPCECPRCGEALWFPHLPKPAPTPAKEG